MLTRVAKYNLERVLGDGAFGTTYLARDTVTGELVALKIFEDSQLALDDFRNEARALMHFNHPNIIHYKDCNYFDVGPALRLFYLATEFADGGDLKAKITVGHISVGMALEYVIQILIGLGECHRQHRLHSDLKPANVFLCRGRVKIGDFGISVDSTNTVDGRACGTPLYMAPEQLSPPFRLSKRTDLWAVGVILYELVYGRHPFSDPLNIQNLGVEAQCHRVAGFPNLDDVIRRALRKNEILRFQTAEAFLEALQQCSRVIVRDIMKAEQGVVGWEYDGAGHDYFEFDVTFTAGFRKPPLLHVSVWQLDSTPTNEGDRTTRYWTGSEVTGPDKAKIRVGTWCNNALFACKIGWLALGE